MVRHYTRNALIEAIKAILEYSQTHSYECSHKGHGRAGRLLEDLLGISGGNHDVADAVGFEIKTSSNSSTPITLFHKDPLPRNSKVQLGAVNALIENYGWVSEHNGQAVKSFRATLYGTWKDVKSDTALKVIADEHKVCVMDGDMQVAYWDTNELVGIASAKLRNILYVNAQTEADGRVRYVDAKMFNSFAPFNFVRALNSGIVAIDFDARSNHGKSSIRNHGTKFRIKEKDIHFIYQTISDIEI